MKTAPDGGAESSSFRDREGRVYLHDERVFRGLSKNALNHYDQLVETAFHHRHLDEGLVIGTRRLAEEENPLSAEIQGSWASFLEHDRVPAVSYPYEWTFSMLKAAALLQLRLLADALEEDFTLKDATPYNVQFVDGKPIFIDLPSFEPLPAGQAWTGYRQFCEMFLFPLMLQAYRGLDFQPFMRARIDGVGVQLANQLLGGKLFKSGVFSHVRLQAMLERRYSGSKADVKTRLQSAGFNKELIKANVRKLRKLVNKLEWKHGQTEWANYTEFHNYSDADHKRKETFIRDSVSAVRPGTTWDIGCNTGQFSAIAAEASQQVLAIDADHLAVERLYLDDATRPNILPLLQNVLDPSPNWGWRNLERRDLAHRCPPDMVLCLAIIHHAVITGNVPLAEFVDWLAGLAPNLVIEYVSRKDDKVKTLLRNKEDIYSDYRLDKFELQLNRHFVVREQLALNQGNRQLYWCRRK